MLHESGCLLLAISSVMTTHLHRATITKLRLCKKILFPYELYVKASSELQVLSSEMLTFIILASSLVSFWSTLCCIQCSWTTFLLSEGQESNDCAHIISFSMNPKSFSDKWITYGISMFCCIGGKFPHTL